MLRGCNVRVAPLQALRDLLRPSRCQALGPSNRTAIVRGRPVARGDTCTDEESPHARKVHRCCRCARAVVRHGRGWCGVSRHGARHQRERRWRRIVPTRHCRGQQRHEGHENPVRVRLDHLSRADGRVLGAAGSDHQRRRSDARWIESPGGRRFPGDRRRRSRRVRPHGAQRPRRRDCGPGATVGHRDHPDFARQRRHHRQPRPRCPRERSGRRLHAGRRPAPCERLGGVGRRLRVQRPLHPQRLQRVRSRRPAGERRRRR